MEISQDGIGCIKKKIGSFKQTIWLVAPCSFVLNILVMLVLANKINSGIALIVIFILLCAFTCAIAIALPLSAIKRYKRVLVNIELEEGNYIGFTSFGGERMSINLNNPKGHIYKSEFIVDNRIKFDATVFYLENEYYLIKDFFPNLDTTKLGLPI